MQHPWVVIKFGGSSVAKPEHWQTITRIIQSRMSEGMRPLLVLSALKNVSNLLEALLHQALNGTYHSSVTQLEALHRGFASSLDIDVSEEVAPWFKQLVENCEIIFQSGQISPRIHAGILSIGEMLSTTIGTQYLKRELAQLAHVAWVDARELLVTTRHTDLWHHFTSAECRFDQNTEVSQKLSALGDVIVTQGFIASDDRGETVLLGREGSDTSAAYLSAILNARQTEIWTDVPGVFSANPREIINARQIPHLTYSQAEMLAQAGAKVLHPRAIEPARVNQIPLFVRCTSLPEEAGSSIVSQALWNQYHTENIAQVLAIASENEVIWIKVNNEYDREQTLQLLARVNALGFDEIIRYPTKNYYHFVLRYSNTDQVQPDVAELQSLLVVDRIQIFSGLAMVSLVGSGDPLKWQTNAMNVVEQTMKETISFTINWPERELVVYLVKSDSHEQLSAILHRALVEKAETSSLHGKDWSSFIETSINESETPQ